MNIDEDRAFTIFGEGGVDMAWHGGVVAPLLAPQPPTELGVYTYLIMHGQVDGWEYRCLHREEAQATILEEHRCDYSIDENEGLY
jgi:hypothetical protein